MLGASRRSKQGLRFDAIQHPIGGRVEERPTSGTGGVRRRFESAYLSGKSVAVCMSCTRTRCTGECEKIKQVERGCVSSRHREAAKKRGYQPARYYEYGGNRYGAKELAEMAGITLRTFIDRLKNGWSVEEAVETPKNKRRGRMRLEYKGVVYEAEELANMAGVSLPAFYCRIKKGWTVEEAVETPNCGKRGRKK